MAETKAQVAEREEARDRLRDLIPPGTTVYTIHRHTSRSGMYRAVDAYVIRDDEPWRISWDVATAIGFRYDRRHEAIGVGGCGMDVGFEVVYNLAHALYRDGFGCIGEGCPSNDHCNGDRDYTPDVVRRHRPWKYDPIDTAPNAAMAMEKATDENGDPIILVDHSHWHASGGYALSQRWMG